MASSRSIKRTTSTTPSLVTWDSWNSSWFEESEYDPRPRRSPNQILWTEITFFYGRKAQLRHKLDDPIAMTEFGKIVVEITPFADLMWRDRIEGPKRYTLQRA